MQTITKPQVLSEPFAEEGIRNTIPVNPTGTYKASLKEGFPQITMTPLAQGGQPPEGADFNGLLNLQSQFYFAFQNGWMPTFDQDVSDAIGGYPQDARLFYTNSAGQGMFLRSMIGNNTHNFVTDPTAIGSYWAIDLSSFGSGKNLGEIFTTLRTDNEFTGAVDCNGSTYNSSEFPDFVAKLDAGNLPVCTFTEYADEIALNGVCAKFAYESGATFKVPTIADVFVEAGSLAQLADYVAPGAPNITGKFSVTNSANGPKGNINATAGCVYADGTTSGAYSAFAGDGNSASGPKVAHIDASRSSSVYGNSQTIQPKAVKLRYMVQIANGVTDTALATCTSVLSDVALLNTHKVIDFQEPTSNNNYTWYKKYNDGWVEQGGRIGLNITSVVLPVEMSDADYQCIVTYRNMSGNTNTLKFENAATLTQASTGFTVLTAASSYRNWFVQGMAA